MQIKLFDILIIKNKKNIYNSEENENKKRLSVLKNASLGESRRIKPRKFECDLCDKIYTTNQKLKFHKLGAHTKVKQFQCSYCENKFTTPYLLSVSIINV